MLLRILVIALLVGNGLKLTVQTFNLGGVKNDFLAKYVIVKDDEITNLDIHTRASSFVKSTVLKFPKFRI